MTRVVLIAGLSALLLACGTNVQGSSSAGTSSGTTGSGGSTAAAGGDGGTTNVGPGGGTTTSNVGGSGGSGGAGQGGSGGAPTEACALLQQAMITNVALDGPWSPGGQVLLNLTLESPIDNTMYPGAGATHDSMFVTPADSENTLFALLADMPAVLPLQFAADAATPSGHTVTFQIELRHINDDCQGVDTATFQAVIQ